MASALYGHGRERFANGEIDWVDDTIKVTLIDTADYAIGANIDVHEYMNTDTVPAAAKVATATLGSKTNTLGVCDAADTTFTAVTGDVSEALIIWKDGGGGGTTASGTTDLLIAYIDTVSSGLPVTPNGGDIIVTWDSGANRIFKL
jgi:hypothetical protein